jgi:tol-pal system protein YbgF
MKRVPCLFFIFVLGMASATHAEQKTELVRLQADVLALQNQVRQLEKTFNESTESIRSLVVQLNDQVGKSSLVLNKISTTLENQTSGDAAALQAILKDVKDLSSRMDETNTRMSALAQQIADMKVQTKPVAQRAFQTPPGSSETPLSPDQIFGEAYNDLIQEHFDLAIQGFNAFLANFPTNEKADDAQYNIGEAFYSAKRYSEAIAAFTKVINDYSTGDKVASALFKRALAQLTLQQKDAAVADFRNIITKFAAAPEANLAKIELTKLGIDPAKAGAKPPIKKRP